MSITEKLRNRRVKGFESYVSNPGICTLRPFSGIAVELGFFHDRNSSADDKLLSYIAGKDVLDLGSGMNGLAIGAALRGSTARIVSINPAFTDKSFEREQQDAIQARYTRLFPDFSENAVEAARKFSNRNTLAMFAHTLDLPEKRFDVALDNAAIFCYAQEELAFLLAAALTNTFRSLRPGGRMRVGDSGIIYTDGRSWKEALVESLGLKSFRHRNGIEVFDPSTHGTN